jgi:hypothetical protein
VNFLKPISEIFFRSWGVNDIIFLLAALQLVVSSRQIAEASGVSKRGVLRDIKDGKFVDLISGRWFFLSGFPFDKGWTECCERLAAFFVCAGHFQRKTGGWKMTAGAALNAIWRRSFFVPVQRGNAIAAHKKSAADRRSKRRMADRFGRGKNRAKGVRCSGAFECRE